MDIEINKSPEALPAHIGIIMDGNGRWAKQRGQIRTAGHEEGLKRAKEIAKAASDLGIKYVTLYAFSTENWKRAKSEVGFLMNLIHTHLLKELKFYKENSIRVRLLGDITGLPSIIQKDILETEEDTKDFTGLTICLAINYGGRDEIVRSIKKMIKEGIPEQEITEGTVSSHFDFPELPDVDLLIRTGGEQRISNFLIWQSSYAEFLFTKTLWPDYNKEEFYNNIAEFQKRTRRFGAVPV
ncbi:MAG: di-trans,poly-cis-decaprenylcistransferase [Treponema sp.]|nr:di-trans,poly-cis-decaprenylcistransferase [Treponema sp.]MBQ2480839.1 di-trans,poly-cis-decaprenylcistransferase [Treponema sp.]MBQ5432938.1 di-trans,poly-cis-decaprenylcistransferase [Treponema sp.]